MGKAKGVVGARATKEGLSSAGCAAGAQRGPVWAAACCFVGLVGAQAWMPAVGLVSDLYRTSSFTVAGVAPLILGYLASFAALAFSFALLRMRGEPSRGTYGVLAGAAFSCIGALLLFLFDGMAPDRLGLLFALAGLLLGSGNCLIVLMWSSDVVRLDGSARTVCLLGAVAVCCALAAFAQMTGASPLLLGATMALSAASALCYAAVAARGKAPERPEPPRGLGLAYARIGVSMGCFGLLFVMMIMQFVIAPHGHASSFTWIFGFVGVLTALAFLGVARIVRKSWDFLFAFRFVAIPVIVAFYPFDTGTDFSVKFALWFSTLALWCFFAVVPGVVREAAELLHVPAFLTAAIGLGGLCVGMVAGYGVALVIEYVGPTSYYFVQLTAIASMVLGLVGSNIVLTRGCLARAYRRTAVPAGGAEADPSLEQKALSVSRRFGLTSRESDVLAILAKGHGLGRVQEELFISEGTAITHRRHIYQKLDVHAKSELIDLVTREGGEPCEDD